MADDFDVKDFTAETAVTIKAKEISAKKYPGHIIYDESGEQILGDKDDAAWDGSAGSASAMGVLKYMGSMLSRIYTSTSRITVGSALATTSFIVGARYIATPPTFTDGQEGGLQVDANGKLLVKTTESTVIGVEADAKSTATDTTPISLVSIFKQISASVQALATAIGATAWDLGGGTSGSRTQRVIIDSSQISSSLTTAQNMATGFELVSLPTDQPWPKGMSPRAFSVAFTTLTRPAATDAYTAGDHISNNATAGSCTALTATVSDTNDDPITITDIRIDSTDTGLAGKKLRAYLFNSDPTASSGVSGGDNAAYSQKKAGYIGSFMGWMETGFSDGSVGRLVPMYNETNLSPAGGFIVTKPVSGAKTLFIQFQAVEAFTPSANSTTIIAIARGFQGRTG
jgi:hypothetical protein